MTATRRHPKALPYLFLTEMWERFGFYVVQGMLVLFMTKAFGFSDNKSYTILGVFTALAYIAPMLGGFLADRFLGFKTAILWGSFFLILGYALMALHSSGFFYFALATIVVGTGLFKPNISSLLGALYSPSDPNRDSGFTIFYIGINLGILLSGIGSGVIKDHFGWHAGFALASFGLIIGVLAFSAGIKWGEIKYKTFISASENVLLQKKFIFVYCFIAVLLISVLLENSLVGDWLLPMIGIVLLFFVFILSKKQNPEYRKQMYMLNFLIISSVLFWAIYWQMFFSVNLFIDRVVDRTVFGITLPTTAFYSLEGVFVILLGPLFAWSWQTLNQSNHNPSPIVKFVIAIFFIALGFLTLVASTYFFNGTFQVSPLWIMLSYFLITIGEMLLSPIGLAAVTVLSPPHLTGMMMGIWFVALGFGGEFAGWLAKVASIPDVAQNTVTQLTIYRHAFLCYTLIAFGVAIILFIMQWALRKVWE